MSGILPRTGSRPVYNEYQCIMVGEVIGEAKKRDNTDISPFLLCVGQ